MDLAKAHLDAATFLLQSTAADLAEGSSNNAMAVVNGKSGTQVAGVERTAPVHLQGAPRIIWNCARLGLWEKAREVYERAVPEPGGTLAAVLQSDILALLYDTGVV